jgi:D-inositol-3-phosphate glycosyltransferase
MAERLAIYHPKGRVGLKHNPFGKDVANLQLYRALARHGGFSRVDVLSVAPVTDAELTEDLADGEPCATAFKAGSILNAHIAAEAGALFFGQPGMADLAWLRRGAGGDRAFSLVGLIHTLAPPAMRQLIAEATTAPTYPWDALICTSPSVKDAMEQMFADWGAHLAERSGGRAPPLPSLPVIPLGMDAAAMAALADRPEARDRLRAEIGLGEADVLVLWVGRLSYFEKAFPQAMFRAVEAAAKATGVKVSFALAGWFPEAGDQAHYVAAAKALAPNVDVHIFDGNDRARLGDLWAASDIFLSLVDNIQETFGITPLEAMAAGLPVVASDWDGYRSTIRHGIEGFLIPTLGGPSGGGRGQVMNWRHVLGLDSYQAYVGQIAQHTAVHVGRCAEALSELIRSPDLRRRMGEAGRARIRETFDWPVVARQIHALVDDLAELRATAPAPPARHAVNPVKGDPFRDFAGFAGRVLSVQTRLTIAAGKTVADLEATSNVALDRVFGAWHAPLADNRQAFELIQTRGGATVQEVLLTFETPKRRAVEMSLAWMAKIGLLDWLD